MNIFRIYPKVAFQWLPARCRKRRLYQEETGLGGPCAADNLCGISQHVEQEIIMINYEASTMISICYAMLTMLH